MSDEKQQNDTPTSIGSPPNERRQLADLYEDASIDPAYQAKARMLNRAIQEIGMGKYQVGLHGYCFLVQSIPTRFAVVSIRCRWVWVVRVNILNFLPSNISD
jgi:hypothetical protein